MTGDVSRGSLSLRAARTDGATALLATGNELALDQVSPYSGATDRRGTFPYMQPAWRNASASPDGSWVLWTRDGESWTVLDTRHAESVELPSTRFRNTLLKWAPDGQSFIALDTTACTLAVVVPAASRQDELASFGDLCQNQDFLLEAWWSPDGSRIAYVLYIMSGQDVIAPDATERYAWTRDGSRVLYQAPPSSDASARVVTVLPDGSDEKVFSVPEDSVPELVWLAGGQYWAGADRDGIWIEKFGTSERFAFQAKGSGETARAFAQENCSQSQSPSLQSLQPGQFF